MSTTQWTKWQAYEMLEPFGFPAEDRRHGELGMVISRGAMNAQALTHRHRQSRFRKALVASCGAEAFCKIMNG